MMRWLVILVFAAQPLFTGPTALLAACCGPQPHASAQPMAVDGCCGEVCPCAMEPADPEPHRPVPMDAAVVVAPPLLVLIPTAEYTLPEPTPRFSGSAHLDLTAAVPDERARPVLCVWLI